MTHLRPIQLLGKLVQQRRTELHLTHQDIADQLGVEAIYIIDLEKGIIKTMPIRMLYQFGSVLQIHSGVLLNAVGFETQEETFYEDFY